MTKKTLQGTRKKKLSHTGFRIRMKTVSGKRTIKLRRKKGRKKIAGL